MYRMVVPLIWAMGIQTAMGKAERAPKQVTSRRVVPNYGGNTGSNPVSPTSKQSTLAWESGRGLEAGQVLKIP
jgi:hypothetical protein